MKKLLLVLISINSFSNSTYSQITTAGFRASFGVDGELRASFLGNASFSASIAHDWFANTTGTPRFVIDTTGAAYITGRYATDIGFRRLPFFRTMRYPAFSVIDNRRLIDAVYIRDYHGSDSTVFAMSNKNGGSPANWTGAIDGNIPQKNDILDIMVHVRRAGSQSFHTIADSLFFIGGIAIDATSGSRYFDFELYQTDIFYDRSTLKFTGFGPDSGHTSWQFDSNTGEVTIPGDVIFSAEFGGSGLQDLVARIWVHKNALLVNSPNFDWDGSFDGDGSGATFGYAGIRPKSNRYFYSGLQNNVATWGGPFKVVRRDDSVQDTYDSNQFLEFAVNMGTLGLDPINLLGAGSQCDMPFRRILVKTRSSASFTAELKDFIGPFDFFNFDATEAYADIPELCGEGTVSTISVINPLPSSVYSWYTPDGNLITDSIGASITVDTPGTYIVRQQLLSGCNVFSEDTVVVVASMGCGVLPANKMDLTGNIRGTIAFLELGVSSNENISKLILERSLNGKQYYQVKILNNNDIKGFNNYLLDDNISHLQESQFYYRVRLERVDGSIRYSNIIRIKSSNIKMMDFDLHPNPVNGFTNLNIKIFKNQLGQIKIFNVSGALMYESTVQLVSGNNTIPLNCFENWNTGVYPIQVWADNKIMTSMLIINRP